MTDFQHKGPSNSNDSKTLLADLDELVLLAQLLVNRKEDVDPLVTRAIELRFNGSTLPASKLLQAVLPSSQSGNDIDFMKMMQVEQDLTYIIPRLLANSAPDRRIEIAQAFLGSDSDPVERSSFMHRVRRGLETTSNTVASNSVTEAQVAKSMRRYLDSTYAPASNGLRSSLEATYVRRPITHSKGNGSVRTQAKKSLPFRIAAGFILILVASAIGTWITKPARIPTSPTDRNEILSQIDGFTPEGAFVFQGSNAFQIEQIIAERTGQRVSLPTISNGNIVGLSIESLTPELVIPTVHYVQDGEDLLVYVLDYRSIQMVSQTLSFDPAVLNQIATSNGLDIHVMEDRSRVVFRNRDDIFITFVEDNPQDVRGLFRFDR